MGDSLRRVSVPHGNPCDWLVLDAVCKGVKFGEDWVEEAGFTNYRTVDITVPREPELHVVYTRWEQNGTEVTTVGKGSVTEGLVCFMATGGDCWKVVDIAVIKDLAYWQDQAVTSRTYENLLFRWAEPTWLNIYFVPDQSSGTGGWGGIGTVRGYYLATYWDGKQTFAMAASYPPRLTVVDLENYQIA